MRCAPDCDDIYSEKCSILFYLFIYFYYETSATYRTLGSDLGRCRSHICVFLIAVPTGAQRQGDVFPCDQLWDGVASALCAHLDGSWGNRIRLKFYF